MILHFKYWVIIPLLIFITISKKTDRYTRDIDTLTTEFTWIYG